MPKIPRKPLSKAARERRRKIQSAQTIYQRQEERYRKLSQSLDGRDAEIYAKAAEQIHERREKLKGIDVRKPSTITDDQKFIIKDAQNFKAGANTDDWQRGETLGRLRLSGTVLGHNFFAATKNMWEGVSYEKRLDAIAKELAKDPEVKRRYGKRPNASQMIDIVSDFFEASYFDDSGMISTGSPPDAAFMRGIGSMMQSYG